MSDEKGFLRAIQKSPGDISLRAVYADWLEERGDPRAEYLRLACELEGPVGVGRDAQKLRDRLHKLRGVGEAAWVAAVTPTWATLRYHWRTFALLGERPVVSKANVGKIERWEGRSGLRFPASLREWYSLEGAEERLRNETQSFSPETLQRALNRTTEVRLESGSQALLAPVGYWSQPISYVRLDAGEDPVVCVNDWDLEGETFAIFAFHRAWSRLTHSTEFLANGIWGSWRDYAEGVGIDFPLLQADEPGFTRRDIAHLTASFSEGLHRLVAGRWREGVHPITRKTMRFFSPTSVLRFYSPGVRVQVTCLGNPERKSTEAHWDISADTIDALVAAVRQHLWNHRTLARPLSSPTKAGQAALKALRK